MKKLNVLFALTFTTATLTTFNASAQFGSLLQKAKDKATEKASDLMDKSTSNSKTATDEPAKTSKKAKINTGFDFVPGDSVVFAENFADAAVGTSPHAIKTNGAGVVVSVNDVQGKWLALEGSASYRLSKQLFYPKHFTVEFDLFASADKINDLNPAYFGFTNDNSVKDYIMGEGTFGQLLYYNNNQVNVGNRNGKNINTDYDLTTYTNRVMHVSINVDGERMAIYLDQTKIADSQLFMPTDTKNFYISAPLKYDNGAKLLVSNLRIARFKKE